MPAPFLVRHLRVLDLELQQICSAIENSKDPDSEGLCDVGEYFIGHGFIAIQRYLASAYSATKLTKSEALDLAPRIKSNLTLAEILNAGANYWKHREEWFSERIMTQNLNAQKMASKTIDTIEIITPFADYTCSNLLAAVLGDNSSLELSKLIPYISEWRGNLMTPSSH